MKPPAIPESALGTRRAGGAHPARRAGTTAGTCRACQGSGVVHVGWSKDCGSIAVACRTCRTSRPARANYALFAVVAASMLAIAWLLLF